MFPIYILDGKTELPTAGTFYAVAKNGIFLSKDTGLIRAMVKVEGISILQDLKARAELRLPKIPSYILAQTLLFFRRVFEVHASEAAVLLYYSRAKSQFMVDAPVQEVSSVSVDYTPAGRFDDGEFQLVGTIHSHCDFSAFHSGVDVHDEKDFDGIHITLGKVDQPYFTSSSTIVVNNNRFLIDSEKVVVGMSKVDYQPPPKSIGYRRTLGVQREKSQEYDFANPGWLEQILGYDYRWLLDYQSEHKEPAAQYYDLILPEGKDYRNCPFPRVWLERVKKKTYLNIKDYLESEVKA